MQDLRLPTSSRVRISRTEIRFINAAGSRNNGMLEKLHSGFPLVNSEQSFSNKNATRQSTTSFFTNQSFIHMGIRIIDLYANLHSYVQYVVAICSSGFDFVFKQFCFNNILSNFNIIFPRLSYFFTHHHFLYSFQNFQIEKNLNTCLYSWVLREMKSRGHPARWGD